MKTQSPTYRIKAQFNYYAGTYNVPSDGYLMDDPSYDDFTGRDKCDIMEFETVRDAYDYLTGGSYYSHPSEGLRTDYNGNGCFSKGGTYVCYHGQYSRPNYQIVSRKSGRCTKAIIAECDAINFAVA
jgi:hypothetical protein